MTQITKAALLARIEALEKALADSLEQQTATSEILRVIASSPTDVQPVFDAILASATTLLGGFVASITRRAGDDVYMAAFTSISESLDATVRQSYPVSIDSPNPHAVAIRHCEPHIIADADTQPDIPEPVRRMARARGWRSNLAVPLRRTGTAIGALGVSRRDARGFTPDEVALLQTFADQAVIAIENVRLFNETREALEQQTAMSEILRVISSSPTDIQPVLDAVAASAARVCGATDAVILRVEGHETRRVAHSGAIPLILPEMRRITPGSPVGRAILECRSIHVHDAFDGGFAREYPDTAVVVRDAGWRTILVVPLVREGTAVGVISIRRTEVRPFTDQEIALLKTFADQAVIAIENVRLFTELEARNRDLTATSDILQVIASSPTDLEPVFESIVRSAARVCDATDATLAVAERHEYRISAHYGPIPLRPVGSTFPIGSGTVMGRTILEGKVYHVEDLSTADAFPQGQRLALELGQRATLCVPLLREGASIGTIMLRRAEAQLFTERQVTLLKSFADQAVIAIENVRLFKELDARNRDLTEALEQQTATGEILRVISGSPTDVQPVFETILDSATRLCVAENGILFQYDDGAFRTVACRGLSPEAERAFRADPMRPGPLSGLGRLLAEQRPIQVADITDDIAYRQGDPLRARTVTLLGARTAMWIPLLKSDTVVGALAIYRRDVRPFTAKQIELVGTFADQAVIAIENVRLFKELEVRNTELTEALEQQTATSEILRVISSSPTDVQPVFDTIVRSAARLCHAPVAGAFLTEGRMVHHLANYGASSEALAVTRSWYPRPVGMDSTPGMAILTRSVVQVPDIEDPSALELIRQIGRGLGFRSSVAVPMLREGEAVGAIIVNRREPGCFSDGEVELLKTFADQAVIAIENVRLFKELDARTGELTQSVEKLTALGEVSHALSSTLDLETVLSTIVSRASQLAGAAGCSIYEYDEAAEHFELRATHNDDAQFVEALRTAPLRKGEGLMGRAAEIRETIQIPDITQPGAYQSSVRDTLIRFGYRALLAVPLLREDQIIGSLSFNRKAPGAFPPEVVDVLKTFATQSALAIQNARLFREIADKSRQLEAASRHKSEFLANMSHELRTPLNAVIGFSEVLLQRMFGALNDKQDEYLKDIYASGQHLLSLINDILDLSKIEAGRMELVSAPFHLPSALENAVTLVRARAARHGIALELDVDPGLGELVGDERKVKQVLLNLLSNAVKFTPEGGRISLKASRRDGAVEISVTDTGIGIAPEDQAAIFEEFRQVGSDDARKQEGTGLGLTLAKKFVELNGGRIWVESEVGRGSTFTFMLPVS